MINGTLMGSLISAIPLTPAGIFFLCVAVAILSLVVGILASLAYRHFFKLFRVEDEDLTDEEWEARRASMAAAAEGEVEDMGSVRGNIVRDISRFNVRTDPQIGSMRYKRWVESVNLPPLPSPECGDERVDQSSGQQQLAIQGPQEEDDLRVRQPPRFLLGPDDGSADHRQLALQGPEGNLMVTQSNVSEGNWFSRFTQPDRQGRANVQEPRFL